MSENVNFHYTGQEELIKAEKSLINYNSFIVRSFIKHSKGAKRILDFGAGVGTLAFRWKEMDSRSKVFCYEIDPTQVQIMIDRNLHTHTDLSQVKDFDYIYTSNVLEHIEDDQLTIVALYNMLKIDGRLGIFVPAHQFLFSKFDEKVEHFRRYSKKDLERKVVKAGFVIERSVFVDSLGFFAWLLIKLSNSCSANQNGYLIQIYDRFFWPVSRFIDSCGCKHLFGKNILLLAHKIR
jgi:SAM-dependent methyltransferase